MQALSSEDDGKLDAVLYFFAFIGLAQLVSFTVVENTTCIQRKPLFQVAWKKPCYL